MKIAIPCLLLTALLATGTLADEVLVISLRGDLDRAHVNAVLSRIEAAEQEDVTHVLFDIDIGGSAGDVGLDLVRAVSEGDFEIRFAALVTGKAPGAALALTLTCGRAWATDEGVLGPLPAGGPVRRAISRNERVAALLPEGLPRHLDPRTPGLIDGIVENLGTALKSWGCVDEEIAEWSFTPAVTDDGGLRQVRLRGPFLKPYLIPIDIPIDDTLTASVERRVKEAEAAGADLIIFEVDSPGGTVHASMDIGDLIFDIDIPTLMMIFKQAYSGAALVSLAGNEILMADGAVLGDCQPIMVSPGGYQVAGEKIQSPLRAVFRKYAEKNGYPIRLAEAMVTEQMKVLRIDLEGDTRYVTSGELEEIEKEHGRIKSEVVVPKDELLTMNASEARDNRFCAEPVSSREDAFRRYGIEESGVVRLEETWAEEFSRFLLAIKALLFFGGIAALYMELKAPGFGVPGGIAILCFALFFAASAVAGIATGIEVMLFLCGVILLAVEILIIPGFGIPGIAGAVMILLSLYMASVKYAFPTTNRSWDSAGFSTWVLETFGAIIGAVVVGGAIARFLPKTSLGRRIILAPAGPPGSLGLTGSGSVSSQRASGLVGASGPALTDLRPAGRIEIDGEPHDAVTKGDYIDRGTRIVVLTVKGNRIVVGRA